MKQLYAKQKVYYQSKKKENQNLTSIPLSRIKDNIKLNCFKLGMHYEEVNESYTSKQSFYDLDELLKDATSSGKRIYRRLYQIKKQTKNVNADANGVLNILVRSQTGEYQEQIDILRIEV